ncbi:hypothetical protein KL86PLE_41292 [uncultured Pleomorphomonas sp.]|uniref:Uncharacterized protein n=1 Tax=uncultured Pleomorphomonas sp. TaxID=442121 RepID=A0A212LJ24_9HYPH|nr:hypothetical protein KL86PLE_41292 [uncultured Pleomorphomonas sp.]
MLVLPRVIELSTRTSCFDYFRFLSFVNGSFARMDAHSAGSVASGGPLGRFQPIFLSKMIIPGKTSVYQRLDPVPNPLQLDKSR